MIGNVAILRPDRAQDCVTQLDPVEPPLRRRDDHVTGAPVGNRMMRRLQVAGQMQEFTPPPELLVPVRLALLGALLQGQAAGNRPDFQQIHRLVADGQTEAMSEIHEPQVAEVGPR
jgi:hypothetical protein